MYIGVHHQLFRNNNVNTKYLKVWNLPAALAHIAVGHDHKHSHRMWAGMVIMMVGVGVAKSAGFFESHLMHYSLDLVGYCIHGLGAVPFIERFIE